MHAHGGSNMLDKTALRFPFPVVVSFPDVRAAVVSVRQYCVTGYAGNDVQFGCSRLISR